MSDARGFLIEENVGLAPMTTWKIGGAARYFCDTGCECVGEVAAWARRKGIPFCVMGGGSNVLVPSAGVDGLVVRLLKTDGQIVVRNGALEVPASMPLGRFAALAARMGLAGFDFLAGIPGTVGGALFMNAGTGGKDGREMADVVRGANAILRDGSERFFDLGEMEFSHRTSVFQKNSAVITRVVFGVFGLEPEASIRRRMAVRVRGRRLREPENRRTAGSVFKSADGVPAAFYIDRAGLKGARVGGAMVSLKHANWIENVGGATSGDVLELAEIVRERVASEFSVRLETEVRVLQPLP